MTFAQVIGRYRTLAWIMGIICGGALIATIGASWLTIQYGSLDVAAAYLRGENLVFSPRAIDVGTARPGERREYLLRLINLSEERVSVIGVQTSCRCVAPSGSLPFEIAGHASHSLPVNVIFVGKGDELVQTVTVFSDLTKSASAAVVLKGRIQQEPIAHE